MTRLRHSPSIALLFGLGLLAAACSSDDKRSLVLIDVQLSYGLMPPQTVVLRAAQDGIDVKSADFTWNPANGSSLQVGLFIPSGVTGSVAIAAQAYTNDVPVAEGTVANLVSLKVGGTVGPFLLLLNPLAPSGYDGGVDAEMPDAEPTGPEVGDAPASPGVDGQPSEVGIPDGARDTTVDAGQPDAPAVGDDAQDAPSAMDGSDAATPPSDAPIDTAVIEVGHTPAWEPAQNIENDPLNASYAPVVAIDPINEHVYVAWEEYTSIKVKRWNRSSETWEKTITVDNRGGPNAPSIGVDVNGNVTVVWGQNSNGATPSTDGLWVSRTTDGVAWSPPTRITSDPSFGAELAVARNGTAHVVYSKQGGGWPLYTAYYDGTGWTENPTALDPNPSYTDSSPRLALNASGDGLLIFRQDWGIVATVLTAQTFTPPMVMDADETASVYNAAVAMNRKGQGMVIWSVGNGAGEALLARTYTPSVGWSSPSPPIVTAYTVTSLALALDEQGLATILWQQDILSGGVNMMGIHGSASDSWSDVTVLETDNKAAYLTNEYGLPHVAIDQAGNVLAVWRKNLSTSDITTYGAYGTRFAGGSWLPQAQLGLKSGLNVPEVRVAVADSGFGAAAFSYVCDSDACDPDAYNVYVAFFR